MSTAAEMAVVISGQNQSGPALKDFQTQLRALQTVAGDLVKSMTPMNQKTDEAGHSAAGATPHMQQLHGALGDLASSAGLSGNSLGQLTEILTGMAPAAAALSAVAIAAEGLKSSVEATEQFGHAVLNLKTETGSTAEEASTLLATFDRYGISADTAGAQLAIFSKKIHGVSADADSGTEQLKGFDGAMQQLGVSVKDANGDTRDMMPILLDLADRFQAMPDGIDKTAIATQLFGRSGRDMILMLNEGSAGLKEAQEAAAKYGLQLSGENVAQVHEFALAQKDLEQASTGLKLEIGLALTPVLLQLDESLAAAIKTLRDSNSTAKETADAFGAISPVLGQVAGDVKGAVISFHDIQAAEVAATEALHQYHLELDAGTKAPPPTPVNTDVTPLTGNITDRIEQETRAHEEETAALNQQSLGQQAVTARLNEWLTAANTADTQTLPGLVSGYNDLAAAEVAGAEGAPAMVSGVRDLTSASHEVVPAVEGARKALADFMDEQTKHVPLTIPVAALTAELKGIPEWAEKAAAATASFYQGYDDAAQRHADLDINLFTQGNLSGIDNIVAEQKAAQEQAAQDLAAAQLQAIQDASAPIAAEIASTNAQAFATLGQAAQVAAANTQPYTSELQRVRGELDGFPASAQAFDTLSAGEEQAHQKAILLAQSGASVDEVMKQWNATMAATGDQLPKLADLLQEQVKAQTDLSDAEAKAGADAQAASSLRATQSAQDLAANQAILAATNELAAAQAALNVAQASGDASAIAAAKEDVAEKQAKLGLTQQQKSATDQLFAAELSLIAAELAGDQNAVDSAKERLKTIQELIDKTNELTTASNPNNASIPAGGTGPGGYLTLPGETNQGPVIPYSQYVPTGGPGSKGPEFVEVAGKGIPGYIPGYTLQTDPDNGAYYYEKNPYGQLAYGGTAMPHTPYLVGESGPEVFVPGSMGRVVPDGQWQSGGGGGSNVTNTFNVKLEIAADSPAARDPKALGAAVAQALAADYGSAKRSDSSFPSGAPRAQQ